MTAKQLLAVLEALLDTESNSWFWKAETQAGRAKAGKEFLENVVLKMDCIASVLSKHVGIPVILNIVCKTKYDIY